MSGDFAEADPVAVALRPTRDGETIAVFEPFPGFAVREGKRIRAAPGQLEHAAPRFFCRAADGAAREQIARLKIASANSVMGQLLDSAPIQILKIRPRNDVRVFH